MQISELCNWQNEISSIHDWPYELEAYSVHADHLHCSSFDTIDGSNVIDLLLEHNIVCLRVRDERQGSLSRLTMFQLSALLYSVMSYCIALRDLRLQHVVRQLSEFHRQLHWLAKYLIQCDRPFTAPLVELSGSPWASFFLLFRTHTSTILVVVSAHYEMRALDDNNKSSS